MKYFLSLSLALAVKSFSQFFYKTKVSFINHSPDFWDDVHLFAFLNHTTLVEPLLFSSLPNWFFRQNIKRTVVPGADITMRRPIVGRIYKTIFPQIVSISRKRDDTWVDFMDRVEPGSLVVIAPEGRMKRPNGLDKHGNPMTIKSGIADIIKKTPGGHMLLAYSGGLHHVQKPGQPFLKLFKTIRISYERINIAEYKNKLQADQPDFHRRVIADLTERMKRNVPKAD